MPLLSLLLVIPVNPFAPGLDSIDGYWEGRAYCTTYSPELTETARRLNGAAYTCANCKKRKKHPPCKRQISSDYFLNLFHFFQYWNVLPLVWLSQWRALVIVSHNIVFFVIFFFNFVRIHRKSSILLWFTGSVPIRSRFFIVKTCLIRRAIFEDSLWCSHRLPPLPCSPSSAPLRCGSAYYRSTRMRSSPSGWAAY